MNIRQRLVRLLFRAIRRFAFEDFADAVLQVQMMRFRVFGDRSRVSVHPTCQVNDALFNVSSGRISVAELAFFGHGVSVITGTHDPTATGWERREGYPTEGRDIIIGKGVWIGSNATILGPCRIGDHAVIGAMALVNSDIPAGALAVGIPARVVRQVVEVAGEEG
jgi:acetyltransferase-like isoleucine patch superfamily enzyme